MAQMNALMMSLVLICAATTFAAALVVTQRRLVANVARRFVRLPRFEQTLLVVAFCVMTICAQKSGTNGVSNAENGASNVEGDVFNAEIGETQRRGEEVDQNGSYPPAKQPEVAARRGAGSMTPPRNEDETSSVGRVIDATLPQANLDATLPQANLDATTSLTNLSSAPSNLLDLRVGNSQAETNVFSITSFSLNRANASVSFTAAWTSNINFGIGMNHRGVLSGQEKRKEMRHGENPVDGCHGNICCCFA